MNIWTATESADRSTTFPIVCHDICFFAKYSRDVVSHIHICRLFWNFCQLHGQCCESWEREGLELVQSLFGWVHSGAYPWPSCVYGRSGGGLEFMYRASNRPMNSVQRVGLGLINWLIYSFIHSINYSCTSTMCMESQIRPGILCDDFPSLQTSTDQGLWDMANLSHHGNQMVCRKASVYTEWSLRPRFFCVKWGEGHERSIPVSPDRVLGYMISFMVVMQIFSPSLLPSHVCGRSIVIFSIELDFAIGLALDSWRVEYISLFLDFGLDFGQWNVGRI